jgi:peptidyl-prolyl cis-trans isomerase B (cyclophilin B)
VPTNQQRRDAAKRKLERQLQRREQQDRARRQRLVIIGVIAAVLVISGGIWLFVTRDSGSNTADSSTPAGTDATAPAEPTTPCSYPASGTAAKEVSAPTNLEPLNTGTVESTIVLNGQDVPVTLNREAAPCGVNAYLSLASQGFYDNTECHRLTVSEQLNILQCGDPSGQGNGGPGYSFATEVATDATYPVGTVALANAGPDTNGSQFFIVYGTTTISPDYTILGTVGGEGMRAVDEVAAQGVQNGAQEGPPNDTAVIAKVTVPDGALDGTGTYETATPSDVLPTDPLATDPLATDPAATDPLPTDPAATDPAVVDSGAATTAEQPAVTSSEGAG